MNLLYFEKYARFDMGSVLPPPADSVPATADVGAQHTERRGPGGRPSLRASQGLLRPTQDYCTRH